MKDEGRPGPDQEHLEIGTGRRPDEGVRGIDQPAKRVHLAIEVRFVESPRVGSVESREVVIILFR
jgi:hypothetical protein